MKLYSSEDLERYLLLHGHNTDLQRIVIDKKMIDSIADLSLLDSSTVDDIQLPRISKFSMTSNAKKFLGEKFHLHSVGYLSDRSLKKILRRKSVESLDDIIPLYNRSATFLDPFHLPVHYDLESSYQAALVYQFLVMENEELLKEAFSKINIFFTGIKMPKTVTSVAPTNYIHEIVHSQLESQKGIIRDYYNAEVLSIFLEFVHAYETNSYVFDVDVNNRINSILLNLFSMYQFQEDHYATNAYYNDYNYYSDSQYLISTLKAFHILFLYEKGNDALKHFIIDGCQKVFDGDMTLEEFLETIGVTYDSSITSEHANYFMKKLS